MFQELYIERELLEGISVSDEKALSKSSNFTMP